MSNSKNILYLLSLVLLMLTGCEAETPTALLPTTGEGPVEVRFHAINVGAGVTVSRTNYSDVATSLQENKIGIWNEFYDNISLTYTENTTPNLSTTNNEKIYYPYDTEELPIHAYAPYSDTELNSETGTVNVKSEWVEETEYSQYITDPIWACDTITKEAPTARLGFKHQMARLKIDITPETGVTYASYTIELTLDRTQHGQMSLETGEITPTERIAGEDYIYTETYHSEDGEMTTSYDHTILPGTKLKKITIRFVSDNETKNYEYTYTEDKPFKEFVAGTCIQMYIDFGKINLLNIHTSTSDTGYNREGI